MVIESASDQIARSPLLHPNPGRLTSGDQRAPMGYTQHVWDLKRHLPNLICCILPGNGLLSRSEPGTVSVMLSGLSVGHFKFSSPEACKKQRAKRVMLTPAITNAWAV